MNTDAKGRTVLFRKVYRIGVQQMLLDRDGRVFVRIDNRTYHSEVELPIDSVPRWIDAFESSGSVGT